MTYTINFTKTLGGAAVFLSLIPWFSFGLLNTDSMPWPFLAYSFFLLSLNHPIRVPKHFLVFGGILSFGMFVALASSYNPLGQNTFRSLYNYLGVMIFYIGFYNYLNKYGFPFHIFVVANITWLMFAVLELFLPEIASIFSNARTTEGRGITSLAPEATFFGIYLFFSSWLIIVGSNYKLTNRLKFLIFLNIFSIFFLAKSSMVILFLVLTTLVFFGYAYLRLIWNKLIIRRTIFFGICCFIGIGAIYQTQQGSRFVELYNQIQENIEILEIFFIDGSLNHRLEHLVYSIHGSVNNYLLPAGYDSFKALKEILDPAYNYFFWSGLPSNKIMSWNGDWLYQLGIFGLIFVSYLIYISYDGSRLRKAEIFLLVLLLFSAIPLAFPLISMLLALYALKSKSQYNE